MSLTFGADPELILYKKGRLVEPSLGMTQENWDEYYEMGQDSYEFRGRANKHEGDYPFHCEEGGVEIHPSPARTPEEGVVKMREAINKLRSLLRANIRVGATSYNDNGCSNGGHIHIAGENITDIKAYRICEGAAYLSALEDKHTAKQRREEYGSAYNIARPGSRVRGLRTWEIRCPSPDWVTAPELITATYTLVQEIASKSYTHYTPFFLDNYYDSYGPLHHLKTITQLTLADMVVGQKFSDLRSYLTTELEVSESLLDIIDDYGKRYRRRRARSKCPIIEVNLGD